MARGTQAWRSSRPRWMASIIYDAWHPSQSSAPCWSCAGTTQSEVQGTCIFTAFRCAPRTANRHSRDSTRGRRATSCSPRGYAPDPERSTVWLFSALSPGRCANQPVGIDPRQFRNSRFIVFASINRSATPAQRFVTRSANGPANQPLEVRRPASTAVMEAAPWRARSLSCVQKEEHFRRRRPARQDAVALRRRY
jgi:hypothetical protein